MVALRRQAPRKMQGRGAAADHHDVIVFHLRHGPLGNAFAFLDHEMFAFGECWLEAERPHRPAIGPVDQAALFQFGKVTAHRLGRYIEALGKFVDAQRWRRPKFGDDPSLPVRL